jgi:hypothetical protein
MASNVFIDDLYPVYGKQLTIIDMGSAWDALLGHTNRKWMRKIDPYTMRRNHNG